MVHGGVSLSRFRAGVGIFDEMLAWQKLHEPDVPALCLTSVKDTVVPPAAVRAFANELRSARPGRSVQIKTMERGAHAQLAQLCADKCREHIRRLVGRTPLGPPQTPPAPQPPALQPPPAPTTAEEAAFPKPERPSSPQSEPGVSLPEPEVSMARVLEIRLDCLADDI